MMVRETLSHHYTNTYQISLTYLKRQKVITQTQKHLKEYQLFDLNVKGQIEITMVHDTPSYDYTPTYQISLIYCKRQKSYDSDTITLQKYELFDLEVKGQRQNVVMLVYGTPCRDYTPTYHISLTYLKRQKSYGPTDSKFANPFRLNKELTPFFVYFLV
jgi:hypothetical protein